MHRGQLLAITLALLGTSLGTGCGDDETSGREPGTGLASPGGAGGAAAGGAGSGGEGTGGFVAGTEVVEVTFESLATGSQTNAPVTFGHPFAVGEIPAGASLAATLSDGTPLPLQVDWLASHADGSLRHAALSLELPELAAGGSEPVTLLTAAEPSGGTPPSLEALLATTFDATVTVTVGVESYHLSARALLEAGAPAARLAGPVATEWLVAGPLVDGSSSAHPHLSARFAVRAYAGGAVRVDLTVENDWTYAPSPQNYQYDVAVEVAGALAYEKSGLTHYRQARWRKIFWSGAEGAVHVRHDGRYLVDTRALPAYDTTLVVPETALAALAGEWTGDAVEPMGAGLVEPYMPMTGGRRDIGPLPSWGAIHLLSMDPRAATATLGTGDLAGSWPIHYRDQDTDLPVSLADYPYMTLLGNPGDTVNPETGQSEAFPECGGDCASPFNPDSAHQPSLAYLPYLLTADAYYLEELMFWANWNMLESNPYYREFEQGLLQWGQVRGQAWSLRTLAEAAYVTPDAHPLKSYFVDRLGYNLDWYLAEYVAGPSANALGVLANGYAFAYTDGRGVAPWQDDFFTWATGHVVELGFADAAPLRDYKAGFVTGRLTDPGFCWVLAPMYSMIVRDSDADPIYATFAEAYEQSLRVDHADIADALLAAECGSAAMGTLLELAAGEMSGYSSSATGYPSNMQIAVATAADSGLASGPTAWSVFEARAVKPDYGPEPQFALVPRTTP